MTCHRLSQVSSFLMVLNGSKRKQHSTHECGQEWKSWMKNWSVLILFCCNSLKKYNIFYYLLFLTYADYCWDKKYFHFFFIFWCFESLFYLIYMNKDQLFMKNREGCGKLFWPFGFYVKFHHYFKYCSKMSSICKFHNMAYFKKQMGERGPLHWCIIYGLCVFHLFMEIEEAVELMCQHNLFVVQK